jgi:methyl-accepting chemotaxis protein
MKARTRLLVLSKFQRWFLINFVIYTALFLGVLTAGLFIWFKLVVFEIMQVAGLLSETFITTLQQSLQTGLIVISILALSLLTLAGFQSFLFSRRIAGPIFALARHLEKCEESGRIEKIKLRKNDLFVDLAEKFNRFADRVGGAKGGR